jgi:beta-lactamase class A
MKKYIINRTFFVCLLFLLAGIAIGYYFSNHGRPALPSNSAINSSNINGSLESHSGGYQFINPLYECNTGENYGTEKLSDLENTISQYIKTVTSNTSVVGASVYFRDLNNGPWFGINENDNFAPSSLLKVPVMMAYFKEAEDNPSVLTQKITYTQDPPGLMPQNFPPKVHLTKGQSYTVEDLIERMIAGSDNVALGLLENNIDQTKIDKVTVDLGITTATNSTPNDFMSTQEYSILFRVLYYATYLDKNYSEKALQILSNSEFNQGLITSVPSSIVVSHKFGERQLQDGTDQLHDCGIVYYPNRPYLLCVMTKGNNFNDLATEIRQISNKIYNEFSNRYH